MDFITRDNNVVDRLELLAEHIVRLKSELKTVSGELSTIKEERDNLQLENNALSVQVSSLETKLSESKQNVEAPKVQTEVRVSKPEPVQQKTFAVDDNERKALKLQIEAMVEKINQHLEA